MRIDVYERVFLALSVVMLLVFAVFLVMAVNGHGIVLPGPAGRVDPTTLVTTPPFDNPGVERVGDTYIATMVARMYQYQPNPVVVPAGVPVTFQVASPDVIHGFRVESTNINAMVLPGEVTAVTATFDEPGEYKIMCHEYCGTGHQTMSGKIVAVPEAEWEQASAQARSTAPAAGPAPPNPGGGTP